MKKDSTVNTFQDGLIMDLNPLLTPNTALTNCLNGTIVTFNGNENVLQNDMGNGRVETAYLPEGYVPVGTAELGGIIYIVSYNPLKDKCQIGCFPSPERNITSDEIKSNTNNSIDTGKFRNDKNEITTTEYKVELLPDNTKLNPGDQYSIYATNKGITNNFDCLSFIGNTNHTMDNYEKENCPYNNENSQIYKNVEIHVVSISDDGKITYLDDTVKWFENTFKIGTDENKKLLPADYYIKEVEGDKNETINNDIENYRSLISTAYNTFNSKTSGKLALLFKLNVIDTFSATWSINNILDITNSEYDQQATITLEMNYTSKHSTINLSNIESNVEIGESVGVYYIKDGHIISKIDNPEVFEINYDDIDTNKQGKKPIKKISKYNFQYNKNKESKVKYTLTPCMNFGKLAYLNKGFTIRLDKIGSGDMNVTGWRYFSISNDVTIDLGLETYPKKGDTVTGVELVFYDPSNTVKVNVEGNVEEKDAVQLLSELKTNEDYIKGIDNSIETIDDKSGYSGNIQHKIYLNDDTYPRNCLFLVDILIIVENKDGKEYHHNPRFLYTCGIFNNKYYEVDDFNELNIDEFIKPEAIVTTKKNTLDDTKTWLPSEAEVSELCQKTLASNATDIEKTEYGYQTMSVQKTTIDGEIEYDSKIVDKNWSELFKYDYKYNKIGHSVNYKDDDPKADTNVDDYTECVKRIYSHKTSENPPAKLVVGSSAANNLYEDYFDVEHNTNTNAIKVKGALYSRMNAKVEEKTVHSEKYLRPVLLNMSDLYKLNLRTYKDSTDNTTIGFKYKYGMYTGDYGKGDPFYLEGYKWEKLKNSKAESDPSYWEANDGEWSTIESYRSPKSDFTKDGLFSKQWNQIGAYKNFFNEWMEEDKNPFAIWFFNYDNKSGAMQKWRDCSNFIENSNGLNYVAMIRTDKTFIPFTYLMKAKDIYNYKDDLNKYRRHSCNELVKVIVSLLCNLYYIVNEPTDMKAPTVTNINYLNDYIVNLNINLTFNISKVKVRTKGGQYYSLTNSNNETHTNIYSNSFPIVVFNFKEHPFVINTNKLYNYYTSHNTNNVNCIAKTLTGDIAINQEMQPGVVYVDSSENMNFTKFEKTSNLKEYIWLRDIIISDDNKLKKSEYSHSINYKLLHCLKISDQNDLYAEYSEITTRTGHMYAAEPDHKSTFFSIIFTGGTDIPVYRYQHQYVNTQKLD